MYRISSVTDSFSPNSGAHFWRVTNENAQKVRVDRTASIRIASFEAWQRNRKTASHNLSTPTLLFSYSTYIPCFLSSRVRACHIIIFFILPSILPPLRVSSRPYLWILFFSLTLSILISLVCAVFLPLFFFPAAIISINLDVLFSSSFPAIDRYL